MEGRPNGFSGHCCGEPVKGFSLSWLLCSAYLRNKRRAMYSELVQWQSLQVEKFGGLVSCERCYLVLLTFGYGLMVFVCKQHTRLGSCSLLSGRSSRN